MTISKAQTHKFQKIQNNKNWCDIDLLDDIELKNNEVLEIQWPSKKISKHKIKVTKYRQEISDMGTPYSMPISMAFVTVENKEYGLKSEVRLSDVKCLCRRI